MRQPFSCCYTAPRRPQGPRVSGGILLDGLWLLFSAVLIWAFLLLVLRLQVTEDRRPSVSPPTDPSGAPPIWGLVAAYIAVLSVLVGITLVGLIWTSS